MRKIPRWHTHFPIWFLLLAAGSLLMACHHETGTVSENKKSPVREIALPSGQAWQPGEYDRNSSKKRLQARIEAGLPIVAHVLVPLCDNEHQGIVPVNSSLGNGQNLRTNLYWGAGYGIKTHFRRASDWELVSEGVPGPAHLLERVIFRKSFSSGATLYLIADAYDGACMQACLQDYFAAAAGHLPGKVKAGTDSLPAWSDADLLVFNGHNGLMDETVDIPQNKDTRHRDAVAIACYSYSYFEQPLATTGAYPLIMTTHLLAPEAYVLRALLDAYGEMKSGAEIRTAVGAAYHKYQKCGLKGATRLFRTGWKETTQ
jgi:hypothetical protein